MSKLVENKAIKIPESHYVGFQKRSSDGVPLGFMTIEGTDKASEKRKATVDAWARGNTWQSHNKQATLPSKTFENKPLVGFKMGKNISYGSGWDSRHDKWRIEDPRGFELEITSGNLEEIMKLCTLERGEILDQCIWGRLGQENILIPLESEVYKTATANTDRINSKGTIKDAKPGSKLIFTNGDEGIYVGKTFASGYDRTSVRRNPNAYDYDDTIVTRTYKTYNDKGIHTYYLLDAKGEPRNIVMRDSLKLSAVEDPAVSKTIEEMCDEVNELIASRHRSVDMPNKYGNGTVLQLSPTLADVSTMEHEFFIREVENFDKLEELIALTASEGYYYSNYVILKTPADVPEYGYGHFYNHDKSKKPTLDIFRQMRKLDRADLFDNKVKTRLSKEEEYTTHRYWNISPEKAMRTVPDYLDLSPYRIEDVSFVKIMGRYKTFSGKVVERDYTSE